MKVFYFLLFTFLFSCTKDYIRPQPFQITDDPENLTEQLLGSWKLYEQTSVPANDWDGDGKAETDMYTTYSACQKEAGFTFQSNGKGLIKNSCTDTRAMNWKITNNSDDFNYQMETNGIFDNYRNNKVIQLNKNFFIVSGHLTTANGKTYSINSRYFRP